MKRCKVWQAISDDTGGIGHIPGRFYWTRDAARADCDGWGTAPEPLVHDAVVLDTGEVFLLKSVTSVYDCKEDVLRERALEKLTPQERKLLGLV